MRTSCQTLCIRRYGSKISGAIQEKEQHPSLHFSVVAIEKRAFGLPLITVDKLTYMTKGCILPFPKKGDFGLAKELPRYKAYIHSIQNLQCPTTKPKIHSILRKNQNGFRRNRSTTSQILTIRRILEGERAKNLQTTLLFVDFTKAFDSIHRGKMEQILLAHGLPKETVAAITILYRNTKMKVRSPDGDIEYFKIVAGVLQGDRLGPYLYHLSRLRA